MTTSTFTDAGLREILLSYDFFVNPNYTRYGVSVAEPASKQLSIDEFINILPFEEYCRNVLYGLKPSRPDNSSVPDITYLPHTIVSWFGGTGSSASPTEFALPLEEAVDADYETFNFKRIGTWFDLDRFRTQLVSMGLNPESLPDPVALLVRAASIAVVRQISRDAINSVDTGSSSQKMLGLAKYYDGSWGTAGADPQVLKSSGIPVDLGKDVRRLLRQIAPSHTGFGIGANALIMSRTARDLLINLETGSYGHSTPQFLPDPLNPGELRYHFCGVPVFIGLVREDELDPAGGGTPRVVPSFGNSGCQWTSIYALRLGRPTGVRMLFCNGNAQNYGLQLEEIPSGTNDVRYKVHGTYSWLIPEHQAAARLWGVDLSTEQ